MLPCELRIAIGWAEMARIILNTPQEVHVIQIFECGSHLAASSEMSAFCARASTGAFIPSIIVQQCVC